MMPVFPGDNHRPNPNIADVSLIQEGVDHRTLMKAMLDNIKIPDGHEFRYVSFTNIGKMMQIDARFNPIETAEPAC